MQDTYKTRGRKEQIQQKNKTSYTANLWEQDCAGGMRQKGELIGRCTDAAHDRQCAQGVLGEGGGIHNRRHLRPAVNAHDRAMILILLDYHSVHSILENSELGLDLQAEKFI